MEAGISTSSDQKNQLFGLKSVESPGRGVLCLDGSGTVKFANNRVAEMFGMDVDSIVGVPYAGLVDKLSSLFTEPDLYRHRSLDLLDHHSTTSEDVFEIAESGAVLHRYSTPVMGDGAQSEGRVEIYSDITFRRRLEREIVERNRDLARLNDELRTAQEQLVQSEKLRVLGEMAAGVAHDLNNVLGAVLANVQLLKRMEEAASLMEGLESIELAALDGAETVRRIKELAKVGADQMLSPVSLPEIVNDVLRVMQPTWQTDNKGPAVQVNSDLLEPAKTVGNASELREALANVVLNAVQAMPDGGSLTLATGLDAEGAYIAVTDTGAGMTEDTRRRLFDPFFTTRGAEGTGLGMSIVYAIVSRHGGQVEVQSEEGRGTTITLRLPSIEMPDAYQEQVDEVESPGPVRALVADDEPVFATAIADMLSEEGHDVVVVTTAAQLGACECECPFDLILADAAILDHIPDQLRMQAKVVALLEAKDEKPDANTVDEVLIKPVRMEALAALTKKISQGRPDTSEVND